MKESRFRLTQSFVFAAMLLGLAARGAAVANYDFAYIDDVNETTNTFLSPSVDTNPDSLASDITSPSTDYTSTAHTTTRVNPEFGDIYNNAGNQAVGWSARANNPIQDTSVFLPANTYFSFQVSAQNGAAINFSTLSLTTGVFRNLASAADTTAYDYTLSYSLDGSSFILVSTIFAGASAGQAATLSGNGTVTASISYDLSGITALQGVTDTAYFQLDPVASTGAAQNGAMSQRAGFIDDLVVDATTVVVPEPQTAALVIVGAFSMLGLVWRNRRRGIP